MYYVNHLPFVGPMNLTDNIISAPQLGLQHSLNWRVGGGVEIQQGDGIC